MKKKYNLYYFIIIILVLLDQISKLLVINKLNLGESIILINNFLKFCYIKNTGISFGILSGYMYIIIVFTLIIIGYVLYELFNNKKESKLFNIGLLLIIGGSLGNLIDRVFRGYVIDFISFTLFSHEMAIFNIADMFITFGIIIYIFYLIGEENERSNCNRRK